MTPTPENRAFCSRQIARFEILDFFSTLSAIGLKELCDALLRNAESEAQAESIVTFCIEHPHQSTINGRVCEKYPSPRYIAKVAATMNAVVSAPEACEHCVDSELPGYVRREYVQLSGIFKGETREVFVPCQCTLGRMKRAAGIQLSREGSSQESEPSANSEPERVRTQQVLALIPKKRAS